MRLGVYIFAAAVLLLAAAAARAQTTPPTLPPAIVKDCSMGCKIISDPADPLQRSSIAACVLYELFQGIAIKWDDKPLTENNECLVSNLIPSGTTRVLVARWRLTDGTESADSNPVVIQSLAPPPLSPPSNFRLVP